MLLVVFMVVDSLLLPGAGWMGVRATRGVAVGYREVNEIYWSAFEIICLVRVAIHSQLCVIIHIYIYIYTYRYVCL